MIVFKEININKLNIFFIILDNYTKLNYYTIKKNTYINTIHTTNKVNLIINKTKCIIFSKYNELLNIIYSNLIYFNSIKYYKYKLKLEVIGLGYKVFYINNFLIFLLGYSHFIKIKLPYSLIVSILDNKYIIIEDIKKNKLGNIMCILNNLKTFNIYKGKGVKNIYKNIKLKLGKAKLLKK